MISWIAEALRKIGIYAIGKEEFIELEVNNFIAELPCNYYRFIRIEKPGSILRAGKIFSKKEFIEKSDTTSKEDYYYSIDNNNVYTNFNGKINLYYQSLPIDSNNYPLILDDVFLKEALVYYIRFRMSDISFIKDPTPANEKILNRDIKNWNISLKKVRANNNVLTADEVEEIAKIWNRMNQLPKK